MLRIPQLPNLAPAAVQDQRRAAQVVGQQPVYHTCLFIAIRCPLV